MKDDFVLFLLEKSKGSKGLFNFQMSKKERNQTIIYEGGKQYG